MAKKHSPLTKIDRLYNRGLLCVGREMERLVNLSIAEKLSITDARDLRDYIKLLGDMKKAHEAIEKAAEAKKVGTVKGMTLEQLESIAGGSQGLSVLPATPSACQGCRTMLCTCPA